MTLFSEWEDKVWGRTRCLKEEKIYQEHELELVAGGFCSFHYHTLRSNEFQVVSGVVQVVWMFGFSLYSKILEPGDTLNIEANVPHQFQVFQSGVMKEAYRSTHAKYPAVASEDIMRLTTGGMMEGLVLRGRSEPCVQIDRNLRWKGGIESCVTLFS